MTSGDRPLLHGTRFLHKEPLIDRVIDAVPPAYTKLSAYALQNIDNPLILTVTGYNELRTNNTRSSLGRLATRTLNTFFLLSPNRLDPIVTPDIRDLWRRYDIHVAPNQTEPILRGIRNLNDIRLEIDGKNFVNGGFAGSGHQSHFTLGEDIIFIDERPPQNIDKDTTWDIDESTTPTIDENTTED